MKRLVIGLVIGLMIGVTGTAIADQSDTVQAVFQKFDFLVNGEEKQLDADPLVYQGTTYLPVRVVANMLGYDVTYKASDRRIELISAVEQPQIDERSENNMEQVIDLDGWISLREYAQGLKQRGGSVIVGGDENHLTITFPSGDQVVTPAPTVDHQGEFTLPMINREGNLRFIVSEGSSYLFIEQINSLENQ